MKYFIWNNSLTQKASILQNHMKIIQVYTFFYWSHYTACSYKKKKHKKIKTYRKSLWKEPAVNRCLLILDLKTFRLQVKGNHYIGREY